MSRIGSVGQASSIQLQILNHIRQIGESLNRTSEQLSTQKRINSAKDDPSGFVQASRFRSQLTGIDAARNSISKASGLLDTADTAASGILSKLNDAKALALDVAGGGLTADEKASKQAALDDILKSINSSSRVEFNGKRLLDGSSGYRVTGIDSSKIADVEVLNKTTSSDVSVAITVATQAAKGAKVYLGGTLGADVTLQVAGALGTTTLSLENGSTTQNITDAINAVSHLTGVTASRIDANEVDFSTTTYGSAASIDLTATAGTFTTTGTGVGTDAVVTVNGEQFTGNGTRVTIHTAQISVNVDLKGTASGSISAFTASGTGLQFQTTASGSDLASIGLADLSTLSLGGVTGKLSTLASGEANSLTSGNVTTALTIIDESISEATQAQARIGAFSKYTIGTATDLLSSQESNTTAALSSIEDVDVAKLSAELTRQQILQQSAYQALQIFDLRNQQVLAVLQSAVARMF